MVMCDNDFGTQICSLANNEKLGRSSVIQRHFGRKNAIPVVSLLRVSAVVGAEISYRMLEVYHFSIRRGLNLLR